jgi:hypothetical protein
MTLLPLTPGLLLSMALRYDHSFGIHGPFDPEPDLASKQMAIFDQAVEYWRTRHDEPITVTDRQLREEMTGVGFFVPAVGQEDVSLLRASMDARVFEHLVCLVERYRDE